MNEADDLCNRIAIMDSGKIAALGSPDSLKKSVGGDTITVKLSQPVGAVPFPPEMDSLIREDEQTIQIFTPEGDETVPRIIDYLSKRGIATESISVSRPSLDDVFMKYTKRRFHEQEMFAEARSTRQAFRRHSA
jgi:ABC-2 type transport system ATP-binding protein